jgi:hypothetical protein
VSDYFLADAAVRKKNMIYQLLLLLLPGIERKLFTDF